MCVDNILDEWLITFFQCTCITFQLRVQLRHCPFRRPQQSRPARLPPPARPSPAPAPEQPALRPVRHLNASKVPECIQTPACNCMFVVAPCPNFCATSIAIDEGALLINGSQALFAGMLIQIDRFDWATDYLRTYSALYVVIVYFDHSRYLLPDSFHDHAADVARSTRRPADLHPVSRRSCDRSGGLRLADPKSAYAAYPSTGTVRIIKT